MNEEWARLDAAAGRSIGLGRYAHAATLLRQATALRPDHADGWFNLGYVLRQTRAYPDALAAYAEALQRDISGPEAVHVNRAAILSEYMERTDEAEAELHAALAKNPEFLPAWLNLGGLMEDVGNADAAADAYEQVLRLAPGNGQARARLAAIRVHKGETAAAIRDLEQQLQVGAESQSDAAELLFGLGNALDAAGRYPEAFAAITRANQINASQRSPSRRYNRRAQERLVDDLIAAFPQRPHGPPPVDGPQMLFICGMFRSGSTVIEQLLGRHPLVQVGGELELIPALVHERLTPYPGAMGNLNADDLGDLRDAYLRTVTANFVGAGYVTDKRPDNFLHIGLIKTLFPNARIICTERAVLDNILSIYFLNFSDTITYSDRLDDAAHYFGEHRRLMTHWENVFGDDILTISYDQVVQTPEPIVTAAWRALGLPTVDADVPIDQAQPIIRTPSNWKARSALHTQSSGRWQNYAAELAPIVAQLKTLGAIA